MKTIHCAALAVLAAVATLSASFAHEGEHGKQPNQTQRKTTRKAGAVSGNSSLALKLKGLHCTGCAMSVRSHLLKVKGVASASVNPEKQYAAITLARGMRPPTDTALKAAVKSAGYVCTVVER